MRVVDPQELRARYQAAFDAYDAYSTAVGLVRESGKSAPNELLGAQERGRYAMVEARALLLARLGGR